MKKEDFKIPFEQIKQRKIILKGKVYQSQGTLVMATETTCSMTKSTFKGVCVGRDEDWVSNKIIPVGKESDTWHLDNFAEKD